MKDKKIKICLDCIYYYVTWDKKFPKGCKGFGFKSSKIPCDVVKESSGESCLLYAPKEKEE